MRLKLLVAIALLPLAACGKQASAPVTEGVTDAMIASAPEGEWLTYGRDYGEQRFSPLTKISDQNVGELGLAWSHDLETARGQEATPLMHDGVLYVSTAWSMVKAFDAKTGELKWSYDPKVPRDTLVRACCDAVNRGVALYGDKVYVGTLDGRLVALEQKTGKVVFEQTVVPNQKDYTITGAPRVAKGKILIGSGGSEYKARGYLAAYDAQTGKELWKFHTVPGNPADGFENKAMEEAAKTWGNSKWWELGGGGTVWDSITYDPATNLVYFGTGNAEPWNPAANGREGDSLYTSSIVAVDADTGEYKWHFQETPEDRWDFDSNAQITAADLDVNGQKRRVVLHAPKNGYFYMLDAKSGQFISAGSFAPQTWTTGIDPKTGRAQINPDAKYEKTGKPFLALPGAAGAHSWQPMSFSQQTGLVYIPANLAAMPYAAAKDWKPTDIGFQTGMDGALTAAPADKAVREGQGRHHRRADCLGSGQAEGSLARYFHRAVERRHAVDRGQPGVPGQCRWLFRRLQRRQGPEAVVVPDPDRGDRRADDLPGRWRTVCRRDGRLGRRVGHRHRRCRPQERRALQHQPPAGVQAGRQGPAARDEGTEPAAAGSAALHRQAGTGCRRGGQVRPLLLCLPRRCRAAGHDQPRPAPFAVHQRR